MDAIWIQVLCALIGLIAFDLAVAVGGRSTSRPRRPGR
jgi:hypothetical protein